MKLATTIQSERGKEIIKTANEFIFQKFTVNKMPIGEIELYYYDDTKTDPECNEGEWLLKFRHHEDDDWDIIAQGNI